jgi:hypothetical protein
VTPVEEMQAAAARLTELRQNSTPGKWRPIVTSGDHWHIHSRVAETIVASIRTSDGENEDVRQPDAELISVLHATLGMQLTIIHHAIEDYSPGAKVQSFLTDDGLALARKINGTVVL